MKKLVLAAFLLLTACSGEAPDRGAPPPAERHPSEKPQVAETAAAKPAPIPAKARLVEEKGELLEFTYAWPAEASAIPALNQRLETALAKDREEALATAREVYAMPGSVPFHPHYFVTKWEAMGDNPLLLSLVADTAFFTGGAHGNTVYEAILWDKKAGKAIEWTDLFQDPARGIELITPAYCLGLDKERAERSGTTLPLTPTGDWRTECPALSNEVVVPVDSDGDGRFEGLRVMLAPYEAGAFAEGSYKVDVPLTEGIRQLIKPDYLPAFR